MKLTGLCCLLVVLVMALAASVGAQTDQSYLATEFVDIYRQTSDSAANWNRDYWQAFAGQLEGDFSPSYTNLTLLTPSGSGPHTFSDSGDDEWETEEMTEDFGDPYLSPAVFRAYDQGLLVGTASWQVPEGVEPIEPEVAPQIVAGPAGSYWQNDVLNVQGGPLYLSFNAGAFQDLGLSDFDEIFIWIGSDNGDEEYKFSTFDDFDDYDPVTGIATVQFDNNTFSRTAGQTYYGQIGYSAVNLLDGIGSTSGELEGHLMAAVFDKWTEFNVQVVPEPSGILAMLCGLASLGGILRRRTR